MARITIFVYRQDFDAFLRDWNSPEHHPMGGTEASALRLGSALQQLGHTVKVTNKPADLRAGCDVFISPRGWELFAHGFRPGRLNYLWGTDDANQPAVAGLKDDSVAARVYATVNAVVLLSEYQTQRWQQALHLAPTKCCQIENGIPAEHFSATVPAAPPGARSRHAYYGSTPFRGLDRLLERWPRVRARVPDAELHVFSSMQIYGATDGVEEQALYATAHALPGVHYHGAQGQTTIRPVTRTCRALAYPCTFPETSCITAMEAMASGCAVVSRAIGALPETAPGNPLVASGDDWLDRWEDELVRVLTDDDHYNTIARHNQTFTAARDWNAIAQRWIARFREDAANCGLAL